LLFGGRCDFFEDLRMARENFFVIFLVSATESEEGAQSDRVLSSWHTPLRRLQQWHPRVH